MLHNDINSLTIPMRNRVVELQKRAKDKGIRIGFSETKRDLDVQIAYYLRSRIPNTKEDIKRLQEYSEKVAWKFSEKECMTANTWTLNSNHLDGNAADLIVYNKDGSRNWNKNSAEWKLVLQIARELDLICGADWPQNDYPHIEYRS